MTSGRTLGEMRGGRYLLPCTPSPLLPRPPMTEGVAPKMPGLFLGKGKGVRPGEGGEGDGSFSLAGGVLRGREPADLEGEGGAFPPGEG